MPSTYSPKFSYFLLIICQIVSSIVSFAQKYLHLTVALCPMRWHLSSACSMMEGVQKSSANHTVDEAVRETQTDAAHIPRRATRIVGSFWKDIIRSMRDAGLTLPSMRISLE